MLAEIEFLDIDKEKKIEELIQKVILQCFKEETLQNTNMYINVILTDAKNIKEINKKYRNIDKETDVLSFPMFEKEEINNIKKESKLHSIKIQEVLGDIVISIPKVQQQAVEFGHSFERELSYMVVHGFYHIIGYDHVNDEEKNEMRLKEENILNKLNITRE